jgi:hypothetical protein
MNQPPGLLRDCGHDLRVTVPGRADGDPGVKIQKLVAINVPHPAALTGFDYRRVASRVGRRNELPVAAQDSLGIRTRKTLSYFGSLH